MILKWNKYIKDNTISHQYKPYSYIGELFKDIYNKAANGSGKMDYYNSKDSYKNAMVETLILVMNAILLIKIV